MPGKNENTLKEAINEMLKAYQLEGKLKEVNILASWGRIMGPMIAKHTQNIYIKNQKLFIQVDSPALKSELSLSKHKIIEVLNKEAGKELVTEVVFL